MQLLAFILGFLTKCENFSVKGHLAVLVYKLCLNDQSLILSLTAALTLK